MIRVISGVHGTRASLDNGLNADLACISRVPDMSGHASLADVEAVGEAGAGARRLRSRPPPGRCRTRRGGSGRSLPAVSSSSQAARGSPSRGWPTLPGLISHRPLPSSSPCHPVPGRRGRRRTVSARVARKKSATWEWPISADPLGLDVEAVVRLRRPARTYSQTGSRGEAWKRPRPRARPPALAREGTRASSRRCCRASRRRLRAADSEKAEMSSSPSTARSWLPTRQSVHRSRTRSVQASGSAP